MVDTRPSGTDISIPFGYTQGTHPFFGYQDCDVPAEAAPEHTESLSSLTIET